MVNFGFPNSGPAQQTCRGDISCRNGQDAHVEYNAAILGKADRLLKWQQAWTKLNGKPRDPKSAHAINDHVIKGVQQNWAVEEILTRVATAGLCG